MQVILHVSELSRMDVAIANANNLLNARANATVEIVLNSEAVKTLIDENRKQSFIELHKRGVIISACNNALKSQAISKEQLQGFIDVVPAGVVHIAQLQHNGYAYIKP